MTSPPGLAQGTNKAAISLQWNDGKEPKVLVWGYRWDGDATGNKAFAAIAREDPRVYGVVARGTLGGIGFDADGDGDVGLLLKDKEQTLNDGVAMAPDPRAYDFYSARDTDDRWRSGWMKGYWAYYTRNDATSDYSYSNVGFGTRKLVDGSWDAWSFSPIGSPSDNVKPDTSANTAVDAPLSISSQPVSTRVTAGSDATFSVEAKSFSDVSYQWQKLTADGTWQNIDGATEASLTVPAVTVADGTQYRVQASIGSISVTSNWARLSVMAFADVTPDNQFYDEIQWLANQGITTGWVQDDSTRTYQPLAPIHRDAMAAFVYRSN